MELVVFLNCMAIGWTRICKKYKGLWIGLKDDEKTVIASGKTVKEVMEKAKEKKYPLIVRI